MDKKPGKWLVLTVYLPLTGRGRQDCVANDRRPVPVFKVGPDRRHRSVVDDAVEQVRDLVNEGVFHGDLHASQRVSCGREIITLFALLPSLCGEQAMQRLKRLTGALLCKHAL